MRAISLLLVLLLLLGGCAQNGSADASPSPSPTHTPEPTQEPTATPYIPPVDGDMPGIGEVTDLLIEDWPNKARLSYRHSGGMMYEAEGRLYTGEGFVLYLLNNTGYAPCHSFEMEAQEDGSLRVRPVPENGSVYSTREGLYIKYAQDAAELERCITEQEVDNFLLIKRDSLAYWNGMFDSNSMLYGALPYDGSYAQLQFNNDIQHLLLIETERGSFLVRLYIEQMREPTQLYYFLCAMLSTFRITGGE